MTERSAHAAVQPVGMKVLFCALCLIVPATCFADLTLVIKDDGSTMTIHIKGQRARLEYAEPSTPPRAVYEFLDLQSRRMTVVDRATGRAVVRTWDAAAEAGIVSGMFADRKVDIHPTGRQRTIDGLACREYRITIGGFVAREAIYWVAEGVDTSDFDRFRQKVDPTFVRLGPKILAIKGLPMRLEVRLADDPSDRTVTEVIRLSRDPLPDSLFVIPAGGGRP